MRRLVLPVLLLLAAACSSTPPTGVEPPPPPPAGTPASVTVQAGDGQQGTPGTAVAVDPSVLVKSASGAPVAGVTVTFSVDSGGGTIVGGTAVTNASGVATLGGWTLGATQGRNVLRVTVTGLAPMFVTASATNPLVVLASNVAIGGGGGAVVYHKPGDPLDGLTVTVPAGAFHVSTQWTVTAKQGVAVPLPSDVFAVGPAIGITNGQAYADSIMTLRIPIQAVPGVALTAFFYDSTTTTLEMVPIVSRDAGSITVATRHFSADQLVTPATALPSMSILHAATPTNTFGAARARTPAWSFFGHPLASMMRSPPPFGTIIVQVVGMSRAALMAKPVFFTSYDPGVDDWEFPNMVTEISSDINLGMVVSALYFNYRFKGIEGALNHRFDQVANFPLDNPQGIRLASDLVDAIAKYTRLPNTPNFAIPPAQTTYDEIMLSMYVTKRPQLVNAYSSDGMAEHSLIAYAGQGSTIYVADANFPGLTYTLAFDGTNIAPAGLSTLPTSTVFSASLFAVLGVSAQIPLTTLDASWAQFFAHTSGDKTFADATLEYYNYATDTWDAIPLASGTLQIVSDTFLVRTNCSNCYHLRAASALATRQYTEVVDRAGATYANDRPDFVRGAVVLMNPRTQILGLTSYAYSNDNPDPTGAPQWNFNYVNFRWLTVISTGVSISPRFATGPVDSAYNFVATNPGNYPHGTTYHWTFSINQAVYQFTNVDDSVQPAILGSIGQWKVKVDIRDPNGAGLGIDSTYVTTTAYQVSIDPAVFIINRPPFEANPGDPVIFVANITSTAFRPAGLAYVWNFGDPGSPVTTAASTVIHTYTTTSSAIGAFPVTVDLYVGNTLVGHGSAAARIKNWPGAWRITSFVLDSSTAVSASADPTVQQAVDSVDRILNRIVSVPSDGLLFLADDSLFLEHGVYFQVAPPFTLTAPTYWVPGAYFAMVARSMLCAGNTCSYTNTGSLTSGTIDGGAYYSMYYSPPPGLSSGGYKNTIHAVKQGTALSGTVSFETFSYGAFRQFQFTAVKVSP